jgi:ankyrin repeat protein
VVVALLERSGDVNAVGKYVFSLSLDYHIFASGCHFNFCNLAASYRDGGTPLHSAAFGGSADVIKSLLAAKADIEAKDT